MKFIAALFAIGLVACLKPVPPEPPKADVIEVKPGEDYMKRDESGCNMELVLKTVTERCCAKACAFNGYNHKAHRDCAVTIIIAAGCTEYDLQMNTGSSVCACDEPVVNTCIPDEE